MTSRALSSASSSRIHRSSATEPKRSSASTLFTLIVSISLTTAAVGAQTLAEVTERVRNYRSTHERAILLELSDLVSIPNFAEDAEQIRRNATHLTQELERRGIEARLLESQGSPPAVYGWLPATKDPATAATVVFYAHYDGQPVDLERWWSPPYEAQLRRGTEKGAAVVDIETTETFDPEWRIYGRSASDDKSPIVAMMAAIDALAASGIDRSVNLKFFLEGEEERGSPHLGEMLRAHRDLLDADLWLFCDGPVHQSREPQVVFGVRGVMGVGVTLYGPNRPLHSGHYGNWAPNPAARLAELIASMRDGEGAILIDGFYDRVRPLTASDRAAIDAAPPIDDELRIELDLARTESNNAPLLERIMLPALNVQGLAAGGVGDQAANAVPSEARAALGFRLVPDLLPEDVKRLVEAHLRGLGYEIVYQEPTAEQKRAHARLVRLDWEDGYRASRASLDGPAAEALLTVVDQIVAAQSKLRGSGPDRVLRLPILGGSLPLYLFDEILGTPLIVLPMVNHDNSQHAPNENVRLQNLWDGIELYAGVIAGLGEVWKGSPNASLSSPNPAGSQTTPADTQTRWPQFRGAESERCRSGCATHALGR